MIFEACVGNFQEALECTLRGAQRLELCDNLMEGGTTPSYGTIKLAHEKLSSEVMVIIRPRGGNFTYSDDEVKIMVEDIKKCKEIGVEGVVIGAIRDGEIDLIAVQKMIDAAQGLIVAFHMAFDELLDPLKGIDTLVDLGVTRILTRGQAENAILGIENIKRYIQHAKGRISILPGGGITVENRDFVIEQTGVTELHGTRIV